MQRVKNIDYDDDDVYSDEEEYAEEGSGEYSAEDKENFAALTPVVRAELDEAGIPATTKQIEDALWHYYWDVGKSVAYLKNSKAPQQPKQQVAKKEKPKSKFDEAAEQSAVIADSKSPMPPLSAADWFKGTPWTHVPAQDVGLLVPCRPVGPEPRLLGGSSKLAKLAEERRRKAAAPQQASQAAAIDSISGLDRLSKPKDTKENDLPVAREPPKKYPIRRRRSPTPPPREPTPPPEKAAEVLPDLRCPPTAFGVTLASTSSGPEGGKTMGLQDLFGERYSLGAFAGPSPDDTVIKAQQGSRGLNK
ncbi:hypothetical protein SMMN14_01412 [Sphaerulina musiva]